MQRFFLLIIHSIVFLFSSQLIAQEPKKVPEIFKYGIGVGAGFATGYGLSFRYVPTRFGGQINFAPYKDKDSERYSVGATLLYKLIESKTANLFLYQANHYYYHSELTYVYDPNQPNQQEQVRITEGYVNNGLGFGIEMIITKRIGLNLMAGYAFYKNFEQLNVTGETALYFKF